MLMVVWVLWGHSCLKSGDPLFFEFAHFDDRDECDDAAAAKISEAQRHHPVQTHVERGVMHGADRQLFFCTRQSADPSRLVPRCRGS